LMPATLRICLGFLTLAAFELRAVQSWPSWLQVPIFQPHTVSDDPVIADVDTLEPESLLLRQLKSVDAVHEPEKAHTLHAAIAKSLRADGKQKAQAIRHLEAARDAAVRSGDADSILSTRLGLADAYLEAGRPKDADKELESAPVTNSLLSPENFWEYSVKLDIAQGRAQFELGDTQLAVETFEDAARIANQPEDIVHLGLHMAAGHACLGHAQKSIEPLRNALQVLEKVHKADTLPVNLQRILAMEVQSRLAEAFHAMGDIASAKAQYEKASIISTTQGASAMKASIANLEKGVGPTLRCPGGAHNQRFQLPTQSDKGKAFKAKIASLLADREYRKAEYELWNNLETQPQPYKSLDAATTLISLGNIYLTSEHKSYFKAAQCFLKALPASLSCCGARSQEAKAAFKGLSFVQDVIPTKDQAKAAAAIQKYLDAVEDTASGSDLGEKMQITI